MKKLLSIVALIAMITVASVANAQAGVTTVSASITDTTTFNADCDNDGVDDAGSAIKTFITFEEELTLNLDLVDSGEMYCQVFADSNAVLGFDVTIAGSWLLEAVVGTRGLATGAPDNLEWALLDDTADATIAAGTEAWGYRLTQTTAAVSAGVTGVGNGVYAYTVNNDAGHVNDPVTFAFDDHTLTSSPDTIISETGIVPNGAFFGTELTMATEVLSEAGDYTEVVTYTQSFN